MDTSFFNKVKDMHIPWPSNSTPRLKKKWNHIYKMPFTSVFITSLFIITKTCKLPKYLSTGKLVNKLWYIHITEYYLPIKGNKLLKRATVLLNLKKIYIKWQELDTKEDILSDCIYMKIKNSQN